MLNMQPNISKKPLIRALGQIDRLLHLVTELAEKLVSDNCLFSRRKLEEGNEIVDAARDRSL
jgi:hypothetical protein